MPRDYDVFISYNFEDKDEARALNNLLVEQIGLKTWFDEQDMLPGDDISLSIEDGLSQALTCLVLVGKSGQGAWQDKEVRAALQHQVEHTYFRVIPVLLPSTTGEPDLPLFLRGKLRIDLRDNYFDGLRKLFQAIRGKSDVTLYKRYTRIDEDFKDTNSEASLPAGYTADVAKIVELLIGESLYSRKDVCIRELIQNAVDACQRRRARVMTSYEPKVFLRINSEEGWFEVDDNGEGMNPDLLKSSFAKIGKSIRDEEGLIQLIKEERVNVIAKFGIGFVSTFMISNHIVISTTFESENQINFSIRAFDERFSYSDRSECNRAPEVLGTTIRVYLTSEQRDLDVLDTASKYLRHVPYCYIVDDGTQIKLEDDWNIETTIISEEVMRSGSYELQWGASPEEGSFIASNWGFLIGEKLNPILPFFMPTWITGEISFLPGVVDLKIARDEIVGNDKALKIKREIQEHLRRFLFKIANETDLAEQKRKASELLSESAQNQTGIFKQLIFKERFTREVGMVRQKLLELSMIYNYSLRYPTVYSRESSEQPPLTLAETNELILDLLQFNYGSEDKLMSLREILENMRKLNISKIYYKYSWYSGFLPLMARLLSGKGYLIFTTIRVKAFLRGSSRGAIETQNIDILRPILKEYNIELEDISDVPPEEMDEIRVKISNLPPRIASTLNYEIKRGTKLCCVNLPEAEVVFERKEVKYLNIAHPIFQEFIEWSNSVRDYELSLFINGLLQTVP